MCTNTLSLSLADDSKSYQKSIYDVIHIFDWKFLWAEPSETSEEVKVIDEADEMIFVIGQKQYPIDGQGWMLMSAAVH